MSDPGYVYLLRDLDTRSAGVNSDYLKLGKTKNDPIKRIKTLQSGNPRLIIKNWYFTPEMTKLETFLHHYFSGDRVRGEWFLLGHCTSNELWSEVPDNGESRDPTPEEQTLSDELRSAREAKLLADAQRDIHDANLRAAIGTSNGIEDILELQLKTYTTWKLDKAQFLASLTDEEENACHELLTKWKSTATFQNRGDNLAALDSTLEAALAAALALAPLPADIPTTNLSNPKLGRTTALETEHQEWLDCKTEVAVQSWIIAQREAALKASIGEYREITGVMKWVREQRTTSTYNESEAIRLFELRMIPFMQPPASATSISVVINEARPYP